MLDKRQAITGILIWVLVFGAFVTLAGVDEFVEKLSAISWAEGVLIFSAVGVGVVAMGSTLYVLGRSVGLGFSLIESIFLNTTVSLAHNLTPFGQAGGAPIGAAILSRHTDRSFEECLATLSAKDVVSFVPAILVFTIGGPYFALFGRSIPDELRPVFAIFTLVVFLVCGTVFMIYRYPERTRGILHRLANALNRGLDRLPYVPSIDEDDVEERLDNFADSLGGIAADRPAVVLASALATTSFLAQGCLLWITLGAVGVEVPIALAIFTVPVSLLASGLPLPGGTGGVESVQVLVIVAVAGANPSWTLTAVVLSRGLVYWTPIVLGSLSLVGFQIREHRA